MNEQNILATELHRPVRKRFQTRRTVTNFIGDLWQTDLVQMDKLTRQNKGYKYYLAVIDTFSKKGFVEPLKTKSKDEVAEAFDKILKRSKVKVHNVQSDQGLEYFNKSFKALMNKYDINHYNTWSDKKAAIVERWNRTIKGKLYKKFTELNTLNWIDMIEEVVEDYNNTKHTTIGMKPNDVNEQNSDIVRMRLATSKTSVMKPKFKVNQWVRISKYKNIFEKGYLANWTEELFKVVKVKNTVPIVYELMNETGEKVKGTFYEKELQATQIPDYFRIEKILQKRVKDGKVELKVTKKGYDQRRYFWISMDDTEKL